MVSRRGVLLGPTGGHSGGHRRQEARDRVGGRLLTEDIEGVRLEVGGQWVSPDQTELLALLDELGLQTYSRYRDGKSVYIGSDGRRTLYAGDTFPVSETTAAEMDKLTALPDVSVLLLGGHVRRRCAPDPVE